MSAATLQLPQLSLAAQLTKAYQSARGRLRAARYRRRRYGEPGTDLKALQDEVKGLQQQLRKLRAEPRDAKASHPVPFPIQEGPGFDDVALKDRISECMDREHQYYRDWGARRSTVKQILGQYALEHSGSGRRSA